jgi:ATP-dependent Clp protease ATP-binding subunit ClpA
MELTIPIYIEVRRQEGHPVHRCRPLLFSGPQASDAHLGLAMSKLTRRLKEHLDKLGREPAHEALAACAFSPDLETHLLKLKLDLRHREAKCKLLFVMFAALGEPDLPRRIAFSPALPELWFEVRGGQTLESRAREVLTRHFRDAEKEASRPTRAGVAAAVNRQMTTPESLSLEGQAWVTSVDLEVQTKQATEKDVAKMLAALFDETKLEGGVELAKVGRCLDWLYPDELFRAVAREHEAAQLARLLESEGNRPVALIGPRLAGKTTVLHEVVRRRVERRGKPYASKQNVWLLSPQRLISGMMYVGQWESRVQAILKTAKKRRHILYFDDFLGLYRAGISRDASLSVADVLKPFILRREVRVLAEMTPEAWQALQERDRGLADQFHVLRIAATDEATTRRVMLEVHRQLEAEHRCRFHLEALPAVLQLHQSYLRDAAFPGKSAAFSRQLASKYAKLPVTRAEVNQEFHQKTGLSLKLVDDRQKLQRDDVVQSLRTKIVGQDEAVRAAADVVMIAKARLADPGRPLASLLFLGPTGVGKTQCAKALAEAMFSGANRLLRFDMNEFATPQAVAQLVGTLHEPDGLLTSAVRREPFSVVLLDEIEKAHPDVFDLLLQVTGEGRLTDALGRTSDFSNAVIVMTSNLGTTAAAGPIGLAPAEQARQHAYIRAAENFFRPEFFNRLDRVIPFESLSRDQMRQIADLLLADVFQRDGLVRRRCALSVEPAAMERIIDAGYHPQFGARALKRAIERQLVLPVAASLAAVKPELPAVISVYPHPDGVATRVQPLQSPLPVARGRIAELDPAEQLDRVEQFSERMAEAIDAIRPRETSAGAKLSPEQVRYYALKEQLHRVREEARSIGEALGAARRGAAKTEIFPRSPSYQLRELRMSMRGVSTRRVLKEVHSARDIHEYLRDAAAGVPEASALDERLAELRLEAAHLAAMQAAIDQPEDALVIVHALNVPAQAFARRLFWLNNILSMYFGFETALGYLPTSEQPRVGFRVAGPGIWPLIAGEAGVHVFCRRHENLLPVQIVVLPATGDPPREQIDAFYDRRQAWLADVAESPLSPRGRGVGGEGATRDLPDFDSLGPLVRFYDEGGPTLDLKSGISLPGFPMADQWKRLLLAGLPLPPELQV